jgi:hypothetical protein
MRFEFSAEVWYWRGPAPFYFLRVPAEESDAIKAIESLATYGWGMIPVNATIGETTWYTALWPKDRRYVLPLKDKIRKAEGLEEGQLVSATMEVIQRR